MFVNFGDVGYINIVVGFGLWLCVKYFIDMLVYCVVLLCFCDVDDGFEVVFVDCVFVYVV